MSRLKSLKCPGKARRMATNVGTLDLGEFSFKITQKLQLFLSFCKKKLNNTGQNSVTLVSGFTLLEIWQPYVRTYPRAQDFVDLALHGFTPRGLFCDQGNLCSFPCSAMSAPMVAEGKSKCVHGMLGAD